MICKVKVVSEIISLRKKINIHPKYFGGCLSDIVWERLRNLLENKTDNQLKGIVDEVLCVVKIEEYGNVLNDGSLDLQIELKAKVFAPQIGDHIYALVMCKDNEFIECSAEECENFKIIIIDPNHDNRSTTTMEPRFYHHSMRLIVEIESLQFEVNSVVSIFFSHASNDNLTDCIWKNN